MEEKRRIAVVIPKYGLVGGAEGFAAELTQRIAADPRFEVHVFANRWAGFSGSIIFHRVPIVRFPKFLTAASFAWFAGREISASGPFDLIHTHDRIFRADVYTMHGIPHRWWIREVRGKKRMSLFDRALARVEDRLVSEGGCRRFLAVSELTRKIFLNEYPIDQARVKVVHPGIDASPYAKLDRERCRREIRGRFGIVPDETLILFVSMNFAVKGLDHILRGLGSLRSKNPEGRVRLLVIGRGDQKAYSRLARELGLGGAVVFTGAVAREKLPEFYLAGDLFAMLSRFDTFGMVVLEAMAAGLPVLISGSVGARDVVREGENGFVVENPADPEAIAGRIATMLNGAVRERMCREALKTAGENSWDMTVARVLNVYEEIRADQRLVISKIPHP
ncbi:MAG: glycosyltransferase family 4 protein [Deltaproteobacteria bacterium]|nr:glycosyltransferase family 4 protein [Deltaproteobacteria bacterium]